MPLQEVASSATAVRQDKPPDAVGEEPIKAESRQALVDADCRIQDTLAVVLAGGKGTRLAALTLRECKPALPFGGVKSITLETEHRFEVEAYLGELTPDRVKMELYAEASAGPDDYRLFTA